MTWKEYTQAAGRWLACYWTTNLYKNLLAKLTNSESREVLSRPPSMTTEMKTNKDNCLEHNSATSKEMQP